MRKCFHFLALLLIYIPAVEIYRRASYGHDRSRFDATRLCCVVSPRMVTGVVPSSPFTCYWDVFNKPVPSTWLVATSRKLRPRRRYSFSKHSTEWKFQRPISIVCCPRCRRCPLSLSLSCHSVALFPG